MTPKQQMLRWVAEMPDDISLGDAIDRLILSAKIERGLQQGRAGQTVSHVEAKARMAHWLK